MNFKHTLIALCLSTVTAGQAFAAVSPEEAAKLDSELTPMGATRVGNADASIPAWNSEGVAVPSNYVAGSGNYVNPYAGEKALYSITADNWQEHADKLTEGTQSLFKKLGKDGFQLNVYPSHRDFVAPDWFTENTRKNATAAKLTNDGQRIDGNVAGVPFPVPQSGIEVLWNHMVRLQADHDYSYASYYVGSNGKQILSTRGSASYSYPMFSEDGRNMDNDLSWLKLRINYDAPSRRAGEILLVHEPGSDYTEGKGRKAWQYLTGQRRVRRAPAVSFDTPNPAVAGTSTYDDAFIFNGSPERYDWKLIGKKEMIVPYSNYDFLFATEVEDALEKKFINPEAIRWELHRVWVVEGTLKEGKRHIYNKRRYYIDEDSWAGVAGETYDSRGNLWRVHYGYPAALYDINSIFTNAYGTYDLVENIYNINTKPIPGKFKTDKGRSAKYYTPQGLARGGIR